MREIKFRAWHPEINILSRPRSLEWMLFDPLSAVVRNDDMVWMQYTGLKDKNGVEIYEGDVLNLENGTRNPYVVSWGEKVSAYIIGEVSLLSMYEGSYRVIGNIYENPELLESAR